MAYDIDRKSAYIPNEEVCEEFVRAVTIGKHTEIARLIQNSERLLEATLNNGCGDILLVGINYDAKNKKHTCTIEEYTK